jgi:hypothetical protein
MHPDNVGSQFSQLPEEIRQPKEYGALVSKLSKLADRHGQGYRVSTTSEHEAGERHSFHLVSPDGKWAGELTHDATDGHVGHMYVEKEHRIALPKLVTHAVQYALRTGTVPPQMGSDMTPQAEKLFRNQLPKTRSSKNVSVTKPNTNYGDK